MPHLEWMTRNQDLQAAARVPYRLLEEVPELSYTAKDPATENMLIQGDNLEALKSLLPFYAGQVKCIFIDPPYNTRSAFEHYDDNLEHTQWLAMMVPRLELLREFLREDGSIWVTIDDNEAHYLKVVMDEVFGRRNFTTSFIWQKVDSPNDNKVPITPDHEYILTYEKLYGRAGFRKMDDESLLDAYPRIDAVTGRHFRDRLLKKNGKNSLRSDRPTMFYPICNPEGMDVFPVHDDGREACWASGKNAVRRLQDDGLLVWKHRSKDDGQVWVPYTREYAPAIPTRPHPTILLDVKTTRQAKAHQTALLPSEASFDTIKPEQLLERVLSICTERDDLVLDSFLGTGTTAAVAHKMGRRFIGVEMGPQAETHSAPRLRQVIDGEPGGISEDWAWEGGGGFRFYRLGKTIFDEAGQLDPAIRFASLAAHVWFSETRTPWRQGSRGAEEAKPSPFLGVHGETAYYLLYNGVLGDKRPGGGNVITRKVLAGLPGFREHEGPKVIYGESSRLGAAALKAAGIVFKQTPYDVRAR